ncbi:flippase [Acidithiobacillus thiooxidans]|uniref:Putative O-antigen transporter n=1 Tax=Acidithiobacillus thiooxidans ATCC 19377 TaxID=637390 RepID=A0A543Q4K2_ACITH|nr:flippase [Acidithiobacillus thiooxidans]MDX5934679.1 flippase [Acidithiobacillus thiooxidans]TQN51198.1 putative O-antigen transporter [Acidithiobacillus thiooxidans ATCC 19377]
MSIRRNTLYNILGQIAPLGISLVTVPLYLRYIGDARYGVLAIIWLFTGYFGVFEMGLSRATAYYLARQHDDTPDVRSTTFWTALWLNLLFGFFGAVVLYLLAKPIFTNFFHIPMTMRESILVSLPWIAAALPVSTLGGVLVGSLEARERFFYINIIGVVNTAVTQIFPLLIAVFVSPELFWLIPTVILARAFGLLLQFFGVWHYLPIVPAKLFSKSQARSLFSYGGWISVSNIVSPLLVTFDRILIGAMLSMQAVTYYTVPYNLVSKISFVPGALANSMFPVFSRSTDNEAKALAENALTLLLAVMTSVTIIGVLLLPLFLTYWISPEFSNKGSLVGMILLSGLWFNGLAFIPYGLLQAQGRPDITAKLHLIELPIFLLFLWGGIILSGLPGAALAWTFRTIIDSLLLFYFSEIKIKLGYFLPSLFMIIISFFVAPRHVFTIQSLFALILVLISLAWSLILSRDIRRYLYLFINFIFNKFLAA